MPRGFTLVELLAVVAVVAVLTGLLTVVVQKVRKTGKEARDVANLRAIGQAFHGYMADNNQMLPPVVTPIASKTLAHYLGYTKSVDDWHNNAQGSIFGNGANEQSIRGVFISGSDERIKPDPLDSYASNEYMGINPTQQEQAITTVVRYSEINRPVAKIYYIPAYFRRAYHSRFSGAASNSPFIDGSNTEYKGPFPALFADGHVEVVESDPSRVGRTGAQLRNEMIFPKN